MANFGFHTRIPHFAFRNRSEGILRCQTAEFKLLDGRNTISVAGRAAEEDPGVHEGELWRQGVRSGVHSAGDDRGRASGPAGTKFLSARISSHSETGERAPR